MQKLETTYLIELIQTFLANCLIKKKQKTKKKKHED